MTVWCFVQLTDTYPGAEGNQFEDALKGEAHSEGEVHVGEQIGEDKRGPVKLQTEGQNTCEEG